jgi:hypothetical protein
MGSSSADRALGNVLSPNYTINDAQQANRVRSLRSPDLQTAVLFARGSFAALGLINERTRRCAGGVGRHWHEDG